MHAMQEGSENITASCEGQTHKEWTVAVNGDVFAATLSLKDLVSDSKVDQKIESHSQATQM